MIAQRLNSVLPEEYIAQPSVRLGDMMAIDVAALERESGLGSFSRVGDEGSLMVASWAPAQPQILLDAEFPDPSEYVVNIYTQDEFRLVAAIELVSPSNKDRPENRKTFVNKCEALLKKEVCVTIVDLVTSRTANLYGELLDELALTGQPSRGARSTLRPVGGDGRGRAGGLNLGSMNSPSGPHFRHCRCGFRRISWCL